MATHQKPTSYDSGFPGVGAPAEAAADLSNNPSPFARGSPPVDLSGPSAYPAGSPPGYFTNPTAAAGNPYSQGAPAKGAAGDQRVSQSAGDTRDQLYDDILRERQPGNEQRGGGTGRYGFTPEPNLAEYYRDESFGRSGEGRS